MKALEFEFRGGPCDGIRIMIPERRTEWLIPRVRRTAWFDDDHPSVEYDIYERCYCATSETNPHMVWKGQETWEI